MSGCRFTAYEHVKKELENKCQFYQSFEYGRGTIANKVPELYLEEKAGTRTYTVPTPQTSEYLRGGIISSFVAFEEFLHRILFETVCEMTVVLPHTKPHQSADYFDKLRSQSSVRFQDDHPILSKMKTEPGFETVQQLLEIMETKILTAPNCSSFKIAFKKVLWLDHDDVSEENLPHKQRELDFGISDSVKSPNFSFCYPVTKTKYSKINLTMTDVTDILDLWYGMRCVAAHGSAINTMASGKALGKFCPPTCTVANDQIKNGYELVKFLHENLDHPADKSSQLDEISHHEFRLISSILDKNVIQTNLKPDLNNKLDELFINLQFGADANVLKEGHGFYHIARVAYFTCKLQRSMYITYRMFVRINQFLLLLSFRIQLALHKWLHEYGEKNNITQLTERWDNPNMDAEIGTVHDEHEEKIRDLLGYNTDDRSSNCCAML